MEPQNASARGRNKRQAVHVRHLSAERNVVRGAHHLRDNICVPMQHNPSEIKDKLLKALDSEYNVVDMDAVLEIITILEKTPITIEALESTRLGKHINEFRRKTDNESLAKRAKDLVRRWRDMIRRDIILLTASSTPPSEPAATTAAAINGSSTTLPGPGPGGTKMPRSTLTSPAMSTASSSPGLSVRKGPSLPPSPTPRLPTSRVAHTPNIEAVARTRANNKRLRKDKSTTPDKDGSPPAKRRSTMNGIYNKDHENNSAHSASPIVPTVVENFAKQVKNESQSSGSTIQTLVSSDNDIVKAKMDIKIKAEMDIVKAKMAQIERYAKVKTTQELLDDLKARGGSPTPPSKDVVEPSSRHRALNFLLAPRSSDEISRNKTEHMVKFLTSQSEEDVTVKRSFSPTPGSPTSRAVQEILSALPPLDLSTIVWSDQDDTIAAEDERRLSDEDTWERSMEYPIEPSTTAEDVRRLLDGHTCELIMEYPIEPSAEPAELVQKEVSNELLGSVLSGAHVEGVTGNFECPINMTESTGDGYSETRTQFREWHEPVWRASYDDQKLLVWPYVIID